MLVAAASDTIAVAVIGAVATVIVAAISSAAAMYVARVTSRATTLGGQNESKLEKLEADRKKERARDRAEIRRLTAEIERLKRGKE